MIVNNLYGGVLVSKIMLTLITLFLNDFEQGFVGLGCVILTRKDLFKVSKTMLKNGGFSTSFPVLLLSKKR